MESMNSSNITSLQEQWNLPLEHRIRRIITGSIILLSGFFINLLALYGTVRRNTRWTPERCLMVNFCICHLMYCLASGEQMVRYATKPYFHHVTCQLRALMVLGSIGCTVFSLLMITFHRYFRVVFLNRPQLGFSTVKKTLALIAASWGVNFTILLLPLTGLWGQFGLEATNQKCYILKSYKFLNSFLVMMYTIIPIVLQAGCYLHIYFKVRRQNRVIAPDIQPSNLTVSVVDQGMSFRATTLTSVPGKSTESASSGIMRGNSTVTNSLRMKVGQLNDSGPTTSKPAVNGNPSSVNITVTNNFASTSGPNTGSGVPSRTKHRGPITAAERRRKREIRLALLSFGFVSTYVLCFIPYSVTNTLNMLNHPIHEFTLNLLWAFLAINPMLYILVEERVRSMLKQKLACKCR